MPYFICPNCKERSVDLDGREGFSSQAVQCRSCGFGFLFELLEDYYPAPETGFVVCDHDARVLAVGRGVFELTGYRDADLIGCSVIEALELSDGRDVEYMAALALGLSGGFSRSETLAGDLEKRFPEDTFAKFTYVPVLRGLTALKRGKPADSVERLQGALRYELAANGLTFNHAVLGGLHSAYVRGEAFFAAHLYAEAAAEFQKILDHRGIVGLDPIGALAHWQLGKAFALSGDKTKAKAAYEAFLALWKDADPDIPILKSAQAEYARL